MTTSSTGKKKTEIPKTEHSRDLMLKAQADALSVKEEARKTIEQIYEKNRHMNTLDETLVKLFGETEQTISRQTGVLLKQNGTETDVENGEDPISSNDFLDKLPVDVYPEIRRKIIEPPHEHSTDSLSEEDIRKEVESFVEETRRIKKEAREALNEADIIRQAARVTVNRAKQEALKMAEDELTRSQEEARKIQHNAAEMIKQAQEEAEAARNHARVAIALAQDKVKEAAEYMAQAREEKRQFKEAAEIARRETTEAIRQAHEESRIARERAEDSIRKVNEQIIRARRLITDSTLDEDADNTPVRGTATDNETKMNELPAESSRHEKYTAFSDDTLKEMYDPLHSISGFARMMLDDNIADSKAQKEFLNIILQQSEALKQRLDRLLR
jgi:hypothetical protein